MTAQLPLFIGLLAMSVAWSGQTPAGDTEYVCNTLAKVRDVISTGDHIDLNDLQKLIDRLDGLVVQSFNERTCEPKGVQLQPYRTGPGITYSIDGWARCSFWRADKSGSLMLPVCWSPGAL